MMLGAVRRQVPREDPRLLLPLFATVRLQTARTDPEYNLTFLSSRINQRIHAGHNLDRPVSPKQAMISMARG